MELQIIGNRSFSKEEQALMDKARTSAKKIDYRIDSPTMGSPNRYVGVTCCVIHAHGALRIDFKIHHPGDLDNVSQAWVGPVLHLTADLFKGECFNDVLLQEIDKGIEEFKKHLLGKV